MRTAPRLPADSSTTGTGDALDLLERDHRRVEALFAAATYAAVSERELLVERIAAALQVHSEVEEELVYPVLARALPAADQLNEQALDDHAAVAALIEQLDGFDGADPMDLEVLRRLQLAVQQHVFREEGELFAAFRRVATSAPDAVASLEQAVPALQEKLIADGDTPTDRPPTTQDRNPEDAQP